MYRFLRLVLLIAAVAGSLIAHAATPQEIVGTVVGVTDGDTLTVLDASKTQHKIRLNGIDAPEISQAFGRRGKEALSAKVFQKPVRVHCHDKDKYGRTIGDVFVDDHDVNVEMVEEGWAWHYVKYSTSQALAVAEEQAKTQKLGLWADPNPIAPWDYRHPVAAPSIATRTSAGSNTPPAVGR